MTIALSYNNDLSRVQIALSSMSVDAVRIERSTNQLFWQTVRGAVEVDTTSGSANVDDYEFAADVANFYRVLDVDDDSEEDADSITPSLGGQVWLKVVRYPFLNRIVGRIDAHEQIEREFSGGVFGVSGRSFPVVVDDVRGSQAFELLFRMDTLEAARDMDLILAVGGVLFIQVPPGDLMPGGYVQLDTTEQQRLYRGSASAPHIFTLPCRVVAPPPPQVVGTTLTWGTVFSLYGDWTALLAANPTWADLLDTVGSPDDLVVL